MRRTVPISRLRLKLKAHDELENLNIKGGIILRNLTLFWALVFSVIISFSGTALAASAIYDDFWDINQGATIGSHSALHSSSIVGDMFGGTSGTAAPYMVFGDGNSDGFAHSVEWETPDLIILQGFNLLASHDYGTSIRMFDAFRLYSGDGLGGWTEIYNWTLPNDGRTTYGEFGSQHLALERTLTTPITAKYFRAEFDQAGDYWGPRITELDAIGTAGAHVPVPGAVWLLGTGLISLAGIRRRSTNS